MPRAGAANVTTDTFPPERLRAGAIPPAPGSSRAPEADAPFAFKGKMWMPGKGWSQLGWIPEQQHGAKSRIPGFSSWLSHREHDRSGAVGINPSCPCGPLQPKHFSMCHREGSAQSRRRFHALRCQHPRRNGSSFSSTPPWALP